MASAAWSAVTAAILKEYNVMGTVATTVSFLEDAESAAAVDAAAASRAKLSVLESAARGQATVEMSQTEYVGRLERLNKALRQALETNQRVTALKIAIQCSKLLGDPARLPPFYPSMWVIVTSVLDTFGELVYARLREMADGEHRKMSARLTGVPSPLPDAFIASDVGEETKETCRNWLYKMACIRELLPRLYVEMALLPCYSFLYDTDFAPVLHRLATSIRGVGNPLVAAYARWFLARKTAVLVRNDERQRDCLRICLQDQLCMARDALSGRYPSTSDLATWRISMPGYYHLFLPVYSAFASALGGVGKQLSLARAATDKSGASSLPPSRAQHPLLQAASISKTDRECFLSVAAAFATHCRCAGVLVHLLNGFSPVVWACKWDDDEADNQARTGEGEGAEGEQAAPFKWEGVDTALALAASCVPSAYAGAPEVAVAVVRGLATLRALQCEAGMDAAKQEEEAEAYACSQGLGVPNRYIHARALLTAWKLVAGVADPARALTLCAPLVEAAAALFPKQHYSPKQQQQQQQQLLQGPSEQVVFLMLQEVASRVATAATLQREVSAATAAAGLTASGAGGLSGASAAEGEGAPADCSVPGLPSPAPSSLGVIEEAGGTPALLGAGEAAVARGAVVSAPGKFWERDVLRHRAKAASVAAGGAAAPSSAAPSPQKSDAAAPAPLRGPPGAWPDWGVTASSAGASLVTAEATLAMSGPSGPALLAAVARIARAVWRWELAGQGGAATSAAVAVGSTAYSVLWSALGPGWQPALAAAALADAFGEVATAPLASRSSKWSDLQTVYAALELARALHDQETRAVDAVNSAGECGAKPRASGAALATALLGRTDFGRNLDRYLSFLGDARRALPGYQPATAALAVLGLRTAAHAWQFVDGNHRPATRRFTAAVFGHTLGMIPCVEEHWLRLALWLTAAAAAAGSGSPETASAAVAAAVDDFSSAPVTPATSAGLSVAVPALRALASAVTGHGLAVPASVWDAVTAAVPGYAEAGWQWPAPWVASGGGDASPAALSAASASPLALLRGVDLLTSALEAGARATTASALLAAILLGTSAGSSGGSATASTVASAATEGKGDVALDPLTLASVTQAPAASAAAGAAALAPLPLPQAALRLEVAAQALTALRGHLAEAGRTAALRGTAVSAGTTVMALVLAGTGAVEMDLMPQAAAAVALAPSTAAASSVEALHRRVNTMLTAVKLDLVA